MNLDDLKQAWKAANDDSTRLLTAEEVSRLLQSRSRTALDRINDGILLDVALSVVLGGGTSAWLLWQQEWAFAGLCAVYFLAALVFYRYKYFAINRSEISDASLHTSLRTLTRRMHQFLRVYDYMIVIGIPLGAAAGFWVGCRDLETGLSITPLQGVLIGLLALGLTAGWMILSRMYVTRLYRRPYEELMACLEELEEKGA